MQSENIITSSLQSSSFPERQSPLKHSVIHKILTQSKQVSDEVTLRPFIASDLHELRDLQLEWFPLQYGDNFYRKILNQEYYCIVAEVQVKIEIQRLNIILTEHQQEKSKTAKESNFFQKMPNSYFSIQTLDKICKADSIDIHIRVIVGALVFTVTDSQGYVNHNWLKSLFFGERNSIYISTLGVISEFRGKGIAKRLLNLIFKNADENQQIKFIYLHVISFNKNALGLYQKNGFEVLEKIKDFYTIKDLYYEGWTLGKFVNLSTRRTKWKEWIFSFWS